MMEAERSIGNRVADGRVGLRVNVAALLEVAELNECA